jgi:hypothetical protein
MLRTPPSRLAPLALVVALALAGCGVDEEPTADPGPTASDTASGSESPGSERPSPSDESPSEAGNRIEITFTGDTVDPSGERVEVTAGEEIELHVTADAPGEIHVHSTPEQELGYEAGSTTLRLTIDQPGVVEVESHDLDKVIVQLEVR